MSNAREAQARHTRLHGRQRAACARPDCHRTHYTVEEARACMPVACMPVDKMAITIREHAGRIAENILKNNTLLQRLRQAGPAAAALAEEAERQGRAPTTSEVVANGLLDGAECQTIDWVGNLTTDAGAMSLTKQRRELDERIHETPASLLVCVTGMEASQRGWSDEALHKAGFVHAGNRDLWVHPGKSRAGLEDTAVVENWYTSLYG